MRKQKLLIGWPIQDSKRYRFAIPNKIWDYKLKPIAFMIFSYLSYCYSNHPADAVSLDDIAKGVCVTISTAKKYLSALANRELVSADQSLTFTLQCRSGEKFFTLPNEIFLLKLPPSAFIVYAYLLLIEDRKTHTCHPSYNTISTATSMSKNTALKSIGVLLETGLIAVEPSSYFDRYGMKWKGNNLYTILPVKSAVDMFHQRQLQQLDLTADQMHIRKCQENHTHSHPRKALYAAPEAGTTPDPPSVA